MKGGLVSIDDIFILQMSKRVLSSLPWGGRKVGEKERGRNLKKHHSSPSSYPYTLHSPIRSKKQRACFGFFYYFF